MYPSTSLFIAVGQLAIVVLIMFSYPLQVQPCRNCLDKIFGGGLIKRSSGEDGEESGEHEDGNVLKHSLLTGGILLLGFVIAYNIDNLQMGKSPGSVSVVFALIG